MRRRPRRHARWPGSWRRTCDAGEAFAVGQISPKERALTTQRPCRAERKRRCPSCATTRPGNCGDAWAGPLCGSRGSRGGSPILSQVQFGAGGTRTYQFGLAGHLETVTPPSEIPRCRDLRRRCAVSRDDAPFYRETAHPPEAKRQCQQRISGRTRRRRIRAGGCNCSVDDAPLPRETVRRMETMRHCSQQQRDRRTTWRVVSR